MRIIGKTPVAPGFMLMTHKQFAADQRDKLEKVLLSLQSSEIGRQYLQATGFQYFDPVTDEDMAALDPYIKVFMKQ